MSRDSLLRIALICGALCAATCSPAGEAPTAMQRAFRAQLADEVRTWLDAQERIRIAIDDGNPPMNFRGPGGDLSGITVDYLRAIEARIGVPIAVVGSTWDAALEAAMAHEVDGVGNAFDKPERRARLAFTQPYLESPMALVLPGDARAPDRIEDLDGRPIAVVAGSARVDFLRRLCPDSPLIEVPGLRQGFLAVMDGRADALLDDLVVASYTMEREFHAGLKIGLLYYDRTLNTSRFGLRNSAPHLRRAFDAAIAAIPPEEHQRIRRRWLRELDSVRVQRSLQLTEAERTWLLEHPVIRVGVDRDWPPFESIGADGAARGLAIDYLREVERGLGVECTIARDADWDELLAMARRGEIDMFSSMAATPERAVFLRFTDSYTSLPIVLFGKRTAGWIHHLDHLAGERLAVVDGYAIEDWIAADHPAIELVPVTDIGAGIALVRRGEALALAGNGLVITQWLNELGFDDLTVIGETPYRNEQRFAVRKDWPVLQGILDKALAGIPPDRRRAIEDTWLHDPAPPETDLRWVLYPLILLGCAAALVAAWSWQLSQAVRARTRDLEASKHALEQQIAARRQAEDRLAQAHKMDAIGQLAGGIAHDFNNMLAGILGATDLLRDRLGDRESITQRCLDTIARSGQRAADLTSKLLAFARRGRTVTSPVDLHACLDEAIPLLERTIDKRIAIEEDRTAEASTIDGDVTLVQNAILNLAINARDAMPDGGRIRFATCNRDLDADAARALDRDLAPGSYVVLAISDTGTGIPDDIVDRIFEPFFTTKEQGKGTGLGLAAVYGTVHDHGGAIRVDTGPSGTTFSIYLPRSQRTARVRPPTSESEIPTGSGCILVVDDEDSIRSTATLLLESLGYTSLTAGDGAEALTVLDAHRDEIDAVILDLVMPVMNGQDCARAILERLPSLPILIVSGYAEEQALAIIEEHDHIEFLKKPYKRSELARSLAAIRS